MSKPKETIISIGHHSLAGVPRSCKDLVAPLLVYEETKIGRRSGRVHVDFEIKQTFAEENGQLVVPVGCLPRILPAIRGAGHNIHIRDTRGLDRESLKLDLSAKENAEKECPGLADCLARQTEGMLAVPRGKRRHRAMGAICRLFPHARIFVTTATKKRAKEIAAELGHFVGGEVEAVRGGNWSSPCRVLAGTFTAFDMARAADWDMLIFEDAIESLGKTIHENRAHFGRHRVFGFLYGDTNLTKKQTLELEVLVGPIIYRHRAKNHQAPLVIEPVFAHVPERPLRLTRNPRQQREQIWGGDRRNQTISALAEACAESNPARLWEVGLFLDEPDPFRRWSYPPRVTILTESAQHADVLHKLLPDWTLMTRRPPGAGLPNSYEGWSFGSVPHRSIISAVCASAYKTFEVDIIVMAAGGSCPFLPSGLERCGGNLLIVDFDDQNTPALVRDATLRRKTYDNLRQREI